MPCRLFWGFGDMEEEPEQVPWGLLNAQSPVQAEHPEGAPMGQKGRTIGTSKTSSPRWPSAPSSKVSAPLPTVK